MDYPFHAETGKGKYELIHLALGMMISRSIIEFSPSVIGKYITLLKVSAEFDSPTFQVNVAKGLRGSVDEHSLSSSLAISPGMDLFRHCQRYDSTFFADASFSGELTHLSVPFGMLQSLIGIEETSHVFRKLMIASTPAVAVHPIPLHISNLLIQATKKGFSGSSRHLFAQAKTLEYLAALVEHLGASSPSKPERQEKTLERVHAIHDQLVACEGRLPTLDELAGQYGRSAKLLNEEFSQEFGLSIFAFITDYRLLQAHEALQHTDISIKQLAARLGYAHVSNFTIAFKHRFGYPPRSLRRR